MKQYYMTLLVIKNRQFVLSSGMRPNSNYKLESQQGETRKNSFYQNAKIQIKKQKNIPAEIWAKRNVLKKLTLQLKFNKNQTVQYQKIRNDLNTKKQQKPDKSSKQTQNKNHVSTLLSPSNQKSMKKLSTAKAQNAVRYTDNFFASNLFSLHGLKSYHYKTTSFKGNQFINVSKAVIFEKKTNENDKKSLFHQKKSSSFRQEKSQSNFFQKRHRRSFSNTESCFKHEQQESKDNLDFFKVSLKKLHINTQDVSSQQKMREKGKILLRRQKTQTSHSFFLKLKRPQQNGKNQKTSQLRPKSCFVKGQKILDFSNCEGWNIREQQQAFPIFFRL